jgi:hypothetical protein
MRLLNILIILGCLVGGYWLVSSIMGPGIDVTRRKKEDASGVDRDSDDSSARARTGTSANTSASASASSRAHEHDWHLILDVPANASQREVEAAYKRRLAKAENSGDDFESIRLRRAYEAAQRRKV